MDGMNSLRMIHSGSDFIGKGHLIRWTEIFIIPITGQAGLSSDQIDPTRIASIFAKAICVAMVPYLKQLKKQGLSPFAVKISLDPENVSRRETFEFFIYSCNTLQCNLARIRSWKQRNRFARRILGFIGQRAGAPDPREFHTNQQFI